MINRLPVVGSDNNTWGTILNDFLEVSHNTDGSLLTGAVIAAGAVTNVNNITPNSSGAVTLAATDVGALTENIADSRYIQSVQLGAANGAATLNNNTQLNSSQVPSSVVSDSRGLDPGDILVYNGSAFVRFPVGSAGQSMNVLSSGTIGYISTRIWASAWGVVADGVTDNTIAAQNALNAAALVPNGCVEFQAGVIITQALTIAPGTTVCGASHGGTILRAKPSTTIPYVLGVTQTGQLNYSVEISNLLVDGNSANGATVTNGIYTLSMCDSIIDKVRVVNCTGNGITLDGTSGYIGSASKVVNCFVRSCDGVGLQINSNATDTMVHSSDIGLNTGQAIYVAGSNSNLVGTIGWGSSVGCSIDPSAELVWISGCRFDSNEYNGVYSQGKNITISGTLVHDNSAAGTGTKAGVEIASGAGNHVISGCMSKGGITGTNQSYGLLLDSGRLGPCTVTGCDFSGNTIGGISYTDVAGDRISNCQGFNPVGVVSSAPSVPASGTPLTNPFPFNCTVYLNGSVDNVYIDGVYIFNSGIGAIPVAAGQTIEITYTGTVTWQWIGE